MVSPYGFQLIENCQTCEQRANHEFCSLPIEALHSFDQVKNAIAYPKGAVLFVQGQTPRGIFVLCKGRIKISVRTGDGRKFILRISEPGEVLGLSATISGEPYQVTAETAEPCQTNFVSRDDFLRFLKTQSDVCFRVAEQLSEKYSSACHEIKSLGLSRSAGQKLARFLLQLASSDVKENEQEMKVKVAFTHEEVAQRIGASRETVNRLLGELRGQGILQWYGSTLSIWDVTRLKELAATEA